MTEKLRLKRLISQLDSYTGDGTGMVSLYVPSGALISDYVGRILSEQATAENVRSRVNRSAIKSALTSILTKLRSYSRTPPNGLALFCGGEVAVCIEPHLPIIHSYYRCDARFHTEILTPMVEDGATFGYVIIDGNGYLLASTNGRSVNILEERTVELPKKHGRGGQSKMRF